MAGEVHDVWLVRHGQTEWSKSGQHTGLTDLDLTEEGERIGRTLGARLGECSFALVLTSPLVRARRTAELAGFAEAEDDPDLVEWDYGAYEGLTSAQIRQSDPGWTIWDSPVPDGETAEQVMARLDRVIVRVRGASGPSLLFGHGHCLRALTARWLGEPVRDGRLYRLDTATVSVLGWEHARPVIWRWNG
ncbi:MAG: histidine phosphatase family protein [Nocardioidaceae bacterium]